MNGKNEHVDSYQDRQSQRPRMSTRLDTIFAENKKPNLFIVGAPRCGTSSVYLHLYKHPDIFMSRVKEPHLFGRDIELTRRPTPEKYASYFSAWNDEKYAGEASVLYLYSKQAATELRAFNSAARIIILLRNPVDFLYSYHRHIVNLGYENISDFEEALEAEPARKQGRMIPPRARKNGMAQALYYKDLATFSDQVQRYLETFERKSVHVVILDDLKTDPVRTYGSIFRFLGVDHDVGIEPKVENACMRIRSPTLLSLVVRGYYLVTGSSLPARATHKLILRPLANWTMQKEPRPPMPQSLRLRLQDEFALEVERLSTMLDRDLHRWSQSSADHRRSTNKEV